MKNQGKVTRKGKVASEQGRKDLISQRSKRQCGQVTVGAGRDQLRVVGLYFGAWQIPEGLKLDASSYS